MMNATLTVPHGWTVLNPPPPGIALVAIEPTVTGDFCSNVVVTTIERPVNDDVDAYLENLVETLPVDFEDAEILDVWLVHDPDPTLLAQRLVMQHRVCASVVHLVQQHTWLGDAIVIVSLTVPADVVHAHAQELIDCLDSVAYVA
jgi:hypothetical protein